MRLKRVWIISGAGDQLPVKITLSNLSPENVPGLKSAYLRILPLLSDDIWNRGCSSRNSQHRSACDTSPLDIAVSMCFQTSCVNSQQLQGSAGSTWTHNQASIGCLFAQRLASKLEQTASHIFHDSHGIQSIGIRFDQRPNQADEYALYPCSFV